MATQQQSAGRRIGRIVFSIIGLWMGIAAVFLFLVAIGVAWQMGTVGTGFVGGLTLALIAVVLTLASYMMARAFGR